MRGSQPAVSFSCCNLRLPPNQQYPQVQHVVVVIQENRTPDNLFQQDQALITNGAHIATHGTCLTNTNPKQKVQVRLGPAPLGTCWDTYHRHNPDWNTMWDNGALDGACQALVDDIDKSTGKKCVIGPPPCTNSNFATCAAMTYAQDTEWDTIHSYYILDPYFQIANQYGYANYMFQTNQGPSFPAHQFLLSGTSAPDYFDDPNSNCGAMYPDCWQWFAAENGPRAGDRR